MDKNHKPTKKTGRENNRHPRGVTSQPKTANRKVEAKDHSEGQNSCHNQGQHTEEISIHTGGT